MTNNHIDIIVTKHGLPISQYSADTHEVVSKNFLDYQHKEIRGLNAELLKYKLFAIEMMKLKDEADTCDCYSLNDQHALVDSFACRVEEFRSKISQQNIGV
jgi:hypothetical protein